MRTESKWSEHQRGVPCRAPKSDPHVLWQTRSVRHRERKGGSTRPSSRARIGFVFCDETCENLHLPQIKVSLARGKQINNKKVRKRQVKGRKHWDTNKKTKKIKPQKVETEREKRTTKGAVDVKRQESE